jgi:hypothetical protein
MGEEVHADEGICVVGYDESQREVLAEAQVEVESQPSVGVHGSAVSCREFLVDPFLASRNEPAWVHTEVETRVVHGTPFTNLVCVEEAACGCGADTCRR